MRTVIPRVGLTVGLSAVMALVTGCSDEQAGAERTSVVTASNAAVDRQPAPEAARQATGLSHLPVPENRSALFASLRRHYPPALLAKKAHGAVLVDVSIDERGIVREVDVVNRPRTLDPSTHPSVVLVDRDPRTGVTVEREATLSYDPAFGPAARAALREVRFLPALRDGRAVPFTMRMTVSFEPPAGAR